MDLLCSHCAFTTHCWRLWYSVPPIFFLDCTQYTHAQPSFSAMAGSAGYGSGFPWDSIPFTLSLQLLPTVLPMCPEDQDKHSHDEWLTEKESERLWTYFSTTSPGRMTPEIPTACRTRDNPSRISLWLPKMGLSQPEMPCADHRSSFGVDTHSSVQPACYWDSENPEFWLLFPELLLAQTVGLEVSVNPITSLNHLPSCGFFCFSRELWKTRAAWLY